MDLSGEVMGVAWAVRRVTDLAAEAMIAAMDNDEKGWSKYGICLSSREQVDEGVQAAVSSVWGS